MYQPLLIGHEQFVAQLMHLGSFPSHWHSEMEIIYCISGKLNVTINEKAFQVEENNVVFINSAEDHEYINDHDSALVMIIEVGYSFLGDVFSELSKLNFVDSVIDLNKSDIIGSNILTKLKDIFDNIITIKQNKTGNICEDWEMKSAIYNLAAVILKHIPHSDVLSEKRRKRMKSLINIQPAISYIRKNYDQNITVSTVAALTGLEESNFCKQFKAATQISFHKYLNSYRIKIACSILESGEYNIYEVGDMVGIKEAKSFSRIFRQFLGMTPSEYKTKLR